MRSVALLFATFTLTGCMHDSGEHNQSFADQADKVIAGTQQACQFVPAVSAIAALLSGGATVSAGALATQICAEVNKLPRPESDEGPSNVTVTVDNVEVNGLLF